MNNALNPGGLNYSRRTPQPQNPRPANHSIPSPAIKPEPCNPKCQGECMRCNTLGLSEGSATFRMMDEEQEVLPFTGWKKGSSSKGGSTIYVDPKSEELSYNHPRQLQQNQLRTVSAGQEANFNSGSVPVTQAEIHTQNLLNLLNQIPQFTNKASNGPQKNETSTNDNVLVIYEPTSTQTLSNQVPQTINETNNDLQENGTPTDAAVLGTLTPGPTPTQQFSNPVPGIANNQKPNGKSLDPKVKDFVPQSHHPRPRNPSRNSLLQQALSNSHHTRAQNQAQGQTQIQVQAQAQAQDTRNPQTQNQAQPTATQESPAASNSPAFSILTPLNRDHAHNYSCKLEHKAIYTPLQQSYRYPTTHSFTKQHYGNNPRNVTWYIIQAITNINHHNKITTENPAGYLRNLGLFLEKNWHLSSSPNTIYFSVCVSVRDMFNIGANLRCREIYSIISFLKLKYSDRDLDTCYFFLNLNLGNRFEWGWEGFGRPYLKLSLALIELWE